MLTLLLEKAINKQLLAGYFRRLPAKPFLSATVCASGVLPPVFIGISGQHEDFFHPSLQLDEQAKIVVKGH